MNFVDNVVQLVKKHSPEILTGIGVVGVGVGTVLACKETRKIDPIINEHKEQMKEIHMAGDMGVIIDKETKESAPYTVKDLRRDTFVTYSKTAGQLAKLYLPSGLVLGGSIACILGSHKILSARNVGLTAAYTGLSQTFDEYRRKIVEKYGENADTEARYSVKAKKVKEGDEERVVYQAPEEFRCSHHSRFFQEDSRYWDKSKELNLSTLFATEQSLNRKLKYRRSHTVTLNEVYDALDLNPSEDGQVLGYRYTPGVDQLDENGLPQVIKFAYWVFDDNKKKNVKRSISEEQQQTTNLEPVMLIDFPNLVPIV